MITVGVKILPKKDILDVQGRAVAQVLVQTGYKVKDCQCGKYIQLKVDTKDQELALKKCHKIAQSVLCNLLVERYELEIL